MPRQVRRFTAAFTAGELGPTLRGRRDVGIYYLGMASLKNVIIRPQGPAKNRPGIRHVASQAGKMRLAPFVRDDDEAYIIVFLPEEIRVYDKDSLALVSTISGTPYNADDLDNLTWVQVADTMLIASGRVPLQELARGTPWTLAPYVFEAPPQYKYHPDRKTTLTASAGTLTAAGGTNNDVFTPNHVGQIWQMGPPSSLKRLKISAYTSPTVVSYTVIDSGLTASATTEWTQQADGPDTGYYRAIAYHDQRLWLGGTTEAPWHLWGSRVGAPYDFMEGSDNDEPVRFDVSAGGRLDPIMHLVAGSGGLEVFTSSHEGVVPAGVDTPITPATAQYMPQSSFGTRRRVIPQRLDAATIFAQRDSGAIREYVYSDVEKAYQSVPLTVRASHLSDDPVAMTVLTGGFGIQSDFLLVVNADGGGAIMTSVRSEEVTAWSDWTSSLLLRDVATVLDRCFVATQDGEGAWALGWLDEAARFDAQLDATAESPKAGWDGFDHLAGQTVSLWADGYDRGEVTINDAGHFGADEAYTSVSVGLPITVSMTTLPIELEQQSLSGRPVRVFRVVVRYLYSAGLRVQAAGSTALRVIPDRRLEGALDMPIELSSQPVTCTVQTGAGWRKDDAPPITVTREGSHPFEIVSLALDCSVSA